MLAAAKKVIFNLKQCNKTSKSVTFADKAYVFNCIIPFFSFDRFLAAKFPHLQTQLLLQLWIHVKYWNEKVLTNPLFA